MPDFLRKKFSYVLLASMVFITTSCIFVVQKEPESAAPKMSLSARPAIKMSDEIVRSNKGDMISGIPENWFFIDLEEQISPDIIAIAVNPDYTLSAVFSVIRNNQSVKPVVDKEGLMGLARMSLARHQKKTAGAVKQLGKYQPVELGSQSFVTYSFSSTGGAANAKAAVFISQLDELYEFALVPMNVTGVQMPSEEEIDKIFKSIMASIKY